MQNKKKLISASSLIFIATAILMYLFIFKSTIYSQTCGSYTLYCKETYTCDETTGNVPEVGFVTQFRCKKVTPNKSFSGSCYVDPYYYNEACVQYAFLKPDKDTCKDYPPFYTTPCSRTYCKNIIYDPYKVHQDYPLIADAIQCGGGSAPTPTPVSGSCINRSFSGSFSPSNVSPSSYISVNCNYGTTALSSIRVLINNQAASCSWNGWSGTTAQYSCQVPSSAGTYDVSCDSQANTCNDPHSLGNVIVPTPAPTTSPAIGYLDAANCSYIGGWAYDPDVSSNEIDVHVYKDGPAGSGTFVTSARTTGLRQDVNDAYGISGNHGFTITTPESLIDGISHPIYVHAIDQTGDSNNVIGGSPKTIQCFPPTLTPTPTPTPTPIPEPWYKIRDGSLVGNTSINSPIPASPLTPYDADDPGNRYLIDNSAGSDPGVATGQTISIGGAQVSAKNWKATGTSYSPQYTVSKFLDYAIAKKSSLVNEISNISEAQQGKINIISGNQTIAEANLTGKRPIVIIVDGNITLSGATLNSLNQSQVLMATGSITFPTTMTAANGLFIADSLSFGTTSNQGIKIIGNAIAQSSFSSERQWSNAKRPGLFIIFDPSHYFEVLEMFSTVIYDWRQIQ